MTKNDNPHSLRMISAIGEVAGEKAAAAFGESFRLSKSADIEKKFAWAEGVCGYLCESFGENEISAIREKCYCCDGTAAAKRMRSYLEKTDSIKAFTELNNKSEKYGWLEYISENEIMLCYPECYCSCVKRIGKPLPKEWCLCTQGYAKKLFSQVFGDNVRAELISSVKNGADKCVVRVTW